MRGSVLEKEGGKKSLRLAYVITDFPSASFFFYDCCQKKKKAASDVFSFGSKRGCVIEFTEAAEYFGGIN